MDLCSQQSLRARGLELPCVIARPPETYFTRAFAVKTKSSVGALPGVDFCRDPGRSRIRPDRSMLPAAWYVAGG
jgi:hypothetical protein